MQFKKNRSPKAVVNSNRGFGIIADDLAGAMDAGAGLLGFGLQPVVTLSGNIHTESAAVIISTDSRDLEPEAAYRKARRQAHKLAGRNIYKKIDSTLRGNIGREILAVMDALRFEKAVVCPAFPANNRTVVDGKLMVGNVPLNEASFAKDSGYPIKEASITALLHEQTGLPNDLIGLDEVNKGPDNVFAKIEKSENKIVVIDAIKEKHLQSLAQALFRNGGAWLPCGSAGLVKELPLAFGYKQSCEKPDEFVVSDKPVLAVIGSRNNVSLKQIKTAEKHSAFTIISVNPEKFIDSRSKLTGLGTLIKDVSCLINAGKNVIITTSLSPYLPSLRESSARLLARLTARVVNRLELAGLFLTGGDIARETCRALGVTGIKILKEIEPGVILGEAMRTGKPNISIVTKAGGFGGENTIVDAVRFLRGKKDE